MGAARKSKHELVEEIVGRLARRHSTAVVLFHHAVAERLGLGPTDHKCLDLLRERGTMVGSDLGAITGLTSGAITGVVARLERAGYLRREPDPHDGRRQILHLALQRAHIQDVIDPLREDVAALLENFDAHQLTAIAEFLARSTDLIYRHSALLRAEAISAMSRTTGIGRAPSPTAPNEESEVKVHR
ncbi:MAG: MarR family winged helix-turn-helix transcriptional regulator [Candidatus Acidiferrales bacterium]